ncbi:MAG: YraN family protein [Armatimonadetes bacterium]|nr:YraN family protein [Armatimonadota bacterium]
MGEKAVAAILERQGWTILATNYRCRQGEVDIIAREREVIAFVEVKTRRDYAGAAPAEAVDIRKQARIVAAAQCFLAEGEFGEVDCRFDVVEVWVQPNARLRIRLHRAAFEAQE